MKIKHLFMLITLSLLMISCNNQKNIKSFELNGSVKGNIPEYIFLEYGKVRDCTVIKNNKFQFKGSVDKPIEACFLINPVSSMQEDWFYLENNTINIKINVEKKIMQTYEINFIKIDTMSGSNTEHIRNDFDKFENINKNDINWNLKLFRKLNEIIEKNPSNNYSGYLLETQVRKENLNKDQITILYKKIDTLALSNIRLETIRRIVYPKLVLKVGSQLIDFELPNTKNKTTNTKAFRGKVTLIDFWASWCAPCRKVNPELLKVYDEFKDNGFEILGISLDTDAEKWKNALRKDNLTWENVIEKEGFNGEISAKYNITQIPSNYLIDQNGKIVAKNVDMKTLKIQLYSLLKIK
jgi:thiol-disulfide isomerase/thioredoxin